MLDLSFIKNYFSLVWVSKIQVEYVNMICLTYWANFNKQTLIIFINNLLEKRKYLEIICRFTTHLTVYFLRRFPLILRLLPNNLNSEANFKILKKMKRKKKMRRKRGLQIKSSNFKSLKKFHQLRIKAIQVQKILDNNKIRSRKKEYQRKKELKRQKSNNLNQ